MDGGSLDTCNKYGRALWKKLPMYPWLTALLFDLKKKTHLTLRLVEHSMRKQSTRSVLELLKEFYPNRTDKGKNVKVYTVVFSIIKSVAKLPTWWRKKAFLSDAEVACADQVANQLGVCWHPMN